MPRRVAVCLAVLALAGCGNGGRARPGSGHVAQIAFEKDERIYVTDGEGRHLRYLVHGESPVISPDGRWIAFYPCNSCDLDLIPAAGGQSRLLARNVDPPRWAPDSRHLATLRVGEIATTLLTIDRVTGKQHGVAVASFFDGYDFSHDSQQLAFAFGRDEENTDVYTASISGGALRRETWDNRSSQPIWAPDGWIDFAHREGRLGPFPVQDKAGNAIGVFHAWGKHRIWRIRPDGRGRHVLTRRLAPAIHDARIGIAPAAWGGKTLLAVAPLDHGAYPYLVDPAGRVRSVVDIGGRGVGSVQGISRDGRFLLLWNELDGPDSHRTLVDLVPTRGGRPRLIARNVGPPTWSR